ncbi:MAG: class I SAM-dependent methyltransferase [Elusimicrobiota bacterium]|jgi:SAM-dependent methyltransferase
MNAGQELHPGWVEQWSRFKDDSLFLFKEWLFPNTLEDLRGKRVLDAGAGHGHHMRMTAPYAREVVGVDLNTPEIARSETADLPNCRVVQGDLARVSFPEPFDVVYCIGVIHHTDDPDRTFANLKTLTKAGGRLIVWCYSREGNWLNRVPLETLKRWVLLRLPAGVLVALAWVLTLLLYPVVWTVYLLPLRFLPYYEYFGNFRILPLRKNVQNAFDKLIAPQTFFIPREQVERWFSSGEFADVHVSPYKGVSWRCSGTKK